MTITVITKYENIREEEVVWWSNRVFDTSWVGNASLKRGGPDLLALKSGFLTGKEVTASSKDPNSNGSATTTWRLER